MGSQNPLQKYPPHNILSTRPPPLKGSASSLAHSWVDDTCLWRDIQCICSKNRGPYLTTCNSHYFRTFEECCSELYDSGCIYRASFCTGPLRAAEEGECLCAAAFCWPRVHVLTACKISLMMFFWGGQVEESQNSLF